MKTKHGRHIISVTRRPSIKNPLALNNPRVLLRILYVEHRRLSAPLTQPTYDDFLCMEYQISRQADDQKFQSRNASIVATCLPCRYLRRQTDIGIPRDITDAPENVILDPVQCQLREHVHRNKLPEHSVSTTCPCSNLCYASCYNSDSHLFLADYTSLYITCVHVQWLRNVFEHLPQKPVIYVMYRVRYIKRIVISSNQHCNKTGLS